MRTAALPAVDAGLYTSPTSDVPKSNGSDGDRSNAVYWRSKEPDDERLAVSDEPTLADKAVFTRKSEDEDDRSKVDSIMLIDNDDEDDDDDDEEEDDEEIMEEIARECSPVSACLTEVGTMAGEIYNSVEENRKRQDSNAGAEEDNLQKARLF
ncbi:hypothetical protein MHU86_15164 [Fragilaria crotonensis]|nr:hypothetical protein MHU86_15164 [Fragilaria crotonensis]